jgi:hypothetical protein
MEYRSSVYRSPIRPVEDDRPDIPPVKIIMRSGVLLPEPEVVIQECRDENDIWGPRRRIQPRARKAKAR